MSSPSVPTPVGVQLFSLPKHLNNDLPDTIEILAQMGYAEVSLFGPYPFSTLEQKRRVELAFEGYHWFGLVRTDRSIPVRNAKAAAIGIKTALTTNNLVFPVPQSQIDINPGKIKQNTGY